MEPWTDVAVLVDNLDFCPYFQSHSINNNHHPFCWGANLPNGNSRIPINEVDCVGASGTWIAQGTVNYPWGTMATSRGLAAPACALAMMGRDNHLGNAVQTNSPYTPGAVGAQPETAHYLWEIPGDMAGKACIIRIRYNMSTYDYASMNHALNQVARVPFVFLFSVGSRELRNTSTTRSTVPELSPARHLTPTQLTAWTQTRTPTTRLRLSPPAAPTS